jgi:hypothetical protein
LNPRKDYSFNGFRDRPLYNYISIGYLNYLEFSLINPMRKALFFLCIERDHSKYFIYLNRGFMTTTLFIICLILAAVLVTVSPVFSIPFLLGAYLIAKFGDMSMESNRSIIAGIIGFIFFLAIIVKIMDWIRH